MTAVSNEPNTAKSTAQLRLSIDKELFYSLFLGIVLEPAIPTHAITLGSAVDNRNQKAFCRSERNPR